MPRRREMPARRETCTQKFSIHTAKGRYTLYVSVGLRPKDKKPGEVWIVLSRTGSSERAYTDALGRSVSVGLQYGIPMQEYITQFTEMRFPPAGSVTGYDGIRFCRSPLDLAFRWIAIEFYGMADLKEGP